LLASFTAIPYLLVWRRLWRPSPDELVVVVNEFGDVGGGRASVSVERGVTAKDFPRGVARMREEAMREEAMRAVVVYRGRSTA
jgi:hypothetical protein